MSTNHVCLFTGVIGDTHGVIAERDWIVIEHVLLAIAADLITYDNRHLSEAPLALALGLFRMSNEECLVQSSRF